MVVPLGVALVAVPPVRLASLVLLSVVWLVSVLLVAWSFAWVVVWLVSVLLVAWLLAWVEPEPERQRCPRLSAPPSVAVVAVA